MESINKNSSSTGGLALDGDEDAAQMVGGTAVNDSILSSDSKQKRGRKHPVNSGQLDSKNSEEDVDGDRTIDIMEATNNKRRSNSTVHRTDRFGNPITSVIGSYSLKNLTNRSKSVRTNKKDDLNSSTLSGGTGEGQTDNSDNKPKRHKLTFMDEVTNDATQLVEVHKIESYKKYN